MRYEELQRQHGGNFLCGYMRNPRFNSGNDKDYVNGSCALHNGKGFVCTRRLPMNMLECELYKEFERQMKLQDDVKRNF